MTIDEVVNGLEEVGLEVESLTVDRYGNQVSDSAIVFVLKLIDSDLRLLYDGETFQLVAGNDVLRWNHMSSELARLDSEGRSFRWMPLEVFVVPFEVFIKTGHVVCLMETRYFLLDEFGEMLSLIKKMLT
jgi:hypothetical protein